MGTWNKPNRNGKKKFSSVVVFYRLDLVPACFIAHDVMWRHISVSLICLYNNPQTLKGEGTFSLYRASQWSIIHVCRVFFFFFNVAVPLLTLCAVCKAEKLKMCIVPFKCKFADWLAVFLWIIGLFITLTALRTTNRKRFLDSVQQIIKL